MATQRSFATPLLCSRPVLWWYHGEGPRVYGSRQRGSCKGKDEQDIRDRLPRLEMRPMSSAGCVRTFVDRSNPFLLIKRPPPNNKPRLPGFNIRVPF